MEYAAEIEQSILGSILIDKTIFDEVKDQITEDHFYFNHNATVYRHCLKFDEPDIILVEQSLKEDELLDVVGKNYLIELVENPTHQVDYYIKILKEKKLLRDVMKVSADTLRKAKAGDDPYILIENLKDVQIETKYTHALVPSQIKERDQNTPKAEKLLFGNIYLDRGVFQNAANRGQTVLTIADSGHGKTQASIFLAKCLVNRGYKVGWFQLEGYDSETASNFNSDNIFICDNLYDIEDIKRECRRLNKEYGLDYIVFDYVQNIECSQNISKTEKVEYISKQIQKMAKELNVVCNPLSQVTIDSTRTGWKQEPGYNDVRWSKQLKQDADLIISVFRPSRIDSLVIDEETVKDFREQPVPYHSVYMKQAKVRHGIQYYHRLQLLHTDNGLQIVTDVGEDAPF